MFITCIKKWVSWGMDMRNESPKQQHTEYDKMDAVHAMIYSKKKDTATGDYLCHKESSYFYQDALGVHCHWNGT
jgi:hypothetical protein